MKTAKSLTTHIKDLMKRCKQSFVSPTMPVGKEHISSLFSPAGKIFNRIYKEGGAASFLMSKCATVVEKIHKYIKKK